MPQNIYALFQILSVAVVAGIVIMCPAPNCWYPLFLSLAFTHYFLAIVYSRRQLSAVMAQRRSWTPFAVVVLAGAGLYAFHVPLYIYFSVHHAFNEAYMPFRSYPAGAKTDEAKWRAAGVVLHLSAIFLMIHGRQLAAGSSPMVAVLVVFLAAFCLYMYYVYRVRGQLNAGELMNLCTLEWLTLVVVGIALVYPITIYHVVFYHVAYWTVFPCVGMLKRGGWSSARSYAVLTAVSLAAMYALVHATVWTNYLGVDALYRQFVIWSFVHITLSFATSRAQPGWIRHWFMAQTTPRPIRGAA